MRMTKGKAIEWINSLIETMKSETSGNYPDPEYKDEVYEALDVAIEALEWHWIPVSERLPKEFESVLVCYKSQGGIAQCVAERLVNMDGSNRWSAMCGQEPIAWMLLPKPYEQQESEVENETTKN